MKTRNNVKVSMKRMGWGWWRNVEWRKNAATVAKNSQVSVWDLLDEIEIYEEKHVIEVCAFS